LAWLITSLIRQLPAVIVPLSGIRLDPAVAAVLLLIGLCVGVASSLIPAYSAARMPILTALRFKD